jgi:excisionase family DNA binding protein
MSTQPFTPITREDAARILSVSVTTVDHMIVTGVLPLPRTLGAQRRLYWHPDEFYGALNRALRSDAPPRATASCLRARR